MICSLLFLVPGAALSAAVLLGSARKPAGRGLAAGGELGWCLQNPAHGLGDGVCERSVASGCVWVRESPGGSVAVLRVLLVWLGRSVGVGSVVGSSAFEHKGRCL